MQVAEHADLRAFNSLRVAARARYLVRLTEAGQIPELLELRQHHALPLRVLGDGSNVLFRSDFDGLVAVGAWRGIEGLEESADTALVVLDRVHLEGQRLDVSKTKLAGIRRSLIDPYIMVGIVALMLLVSATYTLKKEDALD